MAVLRRGPVFHVQLFGDRRLVRGWQLLFVTHGVAGVLCARLARTAARLEAHSSSQSQGPASFTRAIGAGVLAAPLTPWATCRCVAWSRRGDDNANGGQYATAKGLGEVADEIGAKQVFALGDNFYHTSKSHCTNSGICPDNKDGIDGAMRFKTTFEDVYTAESLTKIPFYAIAGNVSLSPARRASPAPDTRAAWAHSWLT
jgi:hypothetical protein